MNLCWVTTTWQFIQKSVTLIVHWQGTFDWFLVSEASDSLVLNFWWLYSEDLFEIFNFSLAQNLTILESTMWFCRKSQENSNNFLKSLFLDLQKCIIPQKNKSLLRLGAQSVTLLSTLRDPTQLRRHPCAFRKQPLLFVPM